MGKVGTRYRNRKQPKTEFVVARQHLSNKEILEQAHAAGYTKWTLKHISNLRHRARKSTPPSKPKARAPRAPSNGHDTMTPKEAQLRRLIFELGFDAARAVFDEFTDMHHRMKGST